MSPDRINRLVELIPTDLPIYGAYYSPNNDDFAKGNLWMSRVAQALVDPAFAWKYSEGFAKHRQSLPRVFIETWMRSAWDHIRNECCVPALREALVLRQAPTRMKRGFLEALLIMPAVTLEQISEVTCVSLDGVRMYENLFFNVRDRFDDICYIASIVYPDTRLVEWQPDYLKNADPYDLLLRAAHNTGEIDVVLKFIGAKTQRPDLSVDEMVKILRLKIFSEADMIIHCGGIHQAGLPVVDLVMKLLIASLSGSKSKPQEQRPGPGIGGPNIGEAIWESCNARRN